ncbi:hypothetical protein HPP92_024409 [Vanilla planifolia]|uniref:ABC-2 type transporter transmembrane domain-containing protein n=1 Tax=Vanilla planifolia TaxID=51239 RepID=A0A835PP71_VANPL|nr:hypothetical protein HPP92_024409 [Vanilla planifolia]
MEGMKGAASFRNPGKQLFLPPKSPFPNLAAPIYGGYGSAGFNGTPMQGEGYRHHQRTSSESFLFEEQQPSWLDDLLSEPETSARRGTHRRSSSDSFACIEGALVYANMDNSAQEECRAVRSIPLWGSQELDTLKDARNYYLEGSLFGESSFHRQKNRVWESAFNKVEELNSNFLSFLYFTYFGMLAMALSPNMQAATILSSSFFILFTLLSGFIIPKPEVQHGGHGSIGLSTTWTLQGLIVTQYGSGFGDQQIRDYVLKHFGYKEDFNGIMIAVLLGRDSKKNDMTTIPRVKQSMTGLRGRRWRPWEKEEGRKLWEQGREKAGGGEEGGGGGDGNKDGNGLKGGSGGKGKGSDGGGGDGW